MVMRKMLGTHASESKGVGSHCLLSDSGNLTLYAAKLLDEMCIHATKGDYADPGGN